MEATRLAAEVKSADCTRAKCTHRATKVCQVTPPALAAAYAHWCVCVRRSVRKALPCSGVYDPTVRWCVNYYRAARWAHSLEGTSRSVHALGCTRTMGYTH
jgi:hypothetical protein